MLIRVGVVVGLAALALVYVWQHATVMQVGYELVSLRVKKTESLQRNRLLQVELAELKAPERVERLAREQLKMQPPDRVEFVEPENKIKP